MTVFYIIFWLEDYLILPKHVAVQFDLLVIGLPINSCV